MTEFKQIIGRGTRLREDLGKTFFTIMDFRNNTRKFFDPEFDGEPAMVDDYTGPKPIIVDPDPGPDDTGTEIEIVPRVNGVPVTVILEQNQCFDANGNLITENFIDFTRKNILTQYATLEEFIKSWNEHEKKQAIIEELYVHEIFIEQLREVAGNPDIDDFDLICHIAFDKKPLTRQERANNVKKRDYLNKYEGVARQVLEGLLDKYATGGIGNLENIEIMDEDPFRQIGSPILISKAFGGKQGLLDAMHGLQQEIYI